MLHPQLLSESLFKKLVPLPHPQKERRRIIQMMEHPHPLLLVVDVLLHPHAVAVKSLIMYLQR